jgi:hypothetical protein
MRVEGVKPLSLDLKGFGVWCSGTFCVKGVRCLSLCPDMWGLAWCGLYEDCHSLGTREALESMCYSLLPSLVPFT